ncbi:right-handed parallel beta-helix repeat-containing protein [Planctomycetota bacterium]
MAAASNSRVLQVILLPIVAMLFCSFAHGNIIYVDNDGQADFDNIQAGIDAAIDGDAVLVASGEYVITEPITFRGKAITVKSEAGRDATTIRMGKALGSERRSVVVFENGESAASVLDGFTITGGRGSSLDHPEWTGDGGGIAFLASSGTVKNCVIVQNQAEDSGGGVTIGFGSSATFTNCVISDNSTVGSGAGLMCWNNSSVTMTDCIIKGNSSTGTTAYVNGYGGGLYCGMNSSLILANCNIAENSAGIGGGGLLCWNDSSLTMTDCEIKSNTANRWGGGVQCDTASANLTNCIIARNSAFGTGGGGVFCPYPDSFMILTNCTVWGNSAPQTGGGIKCWQGSATVTNSIIWGNEAPRGSEISLEQGGTLSLSYSNVAGGGPGVDVPGGCTLNWGEGNFDADPLFARIGYWDDKGTRDPSDDVWVDGDYHLKSQASRWDPDSESWIQDEITSPCIDAGDPMSPIGWELFPNGGFVNMGAYGGRPKASKSYFGEPVCETIVAGDINGDGRVDRADLEIMALHWTDEEPLPLP